MSVGDSPKMKNLMKKAIRRAMESWPRRNPWVKEREEEEEEEDWGGGGGGYVSGSERLVGCVLLWIETAYYSFPFCYMLLLLIVTEVFHVVDVVADHIESGP